MVNVCHRAIYFKPNGNGKTGKKSSYERGSQFERGTRSGFTNLQPALTRNPPDGDSISRNILQYSKRFGAKFRNACYNSRG